MTRSKKQEETPATSDFDEFTNEEADYRNLTITDVGQLKKAQYTFQRWLLDDNEELFYFQNTLRGVMLNPSTGKYETNTEFSMMNDRGARWLTETYLLNVLKDARLSVLDEEEIKNLLKRNGDFLNRYLEEMQVPFGIKNYGDINFIIRQSLNKLHLALKRSLLGAEQDRLGTTQKVISEERMTPVEQPGQEKRRSMRDWIPF